MKSLLFTLVLIQLCGYKINAQGIGIAANNIPPHSSAMLDVQSTNKGLLIPRMTAQQRLSIVTPANGLLVFDTDSSYFFMHTGSWKSVKSISLLSEIISGTNPNDLIKWDGTKWIVASLGYYYRDSDSDGYGDLYRPVSSVSATPPAGFVSNGTDCNDNSSAAYPGNPEICDGIDNNCNGVIDEGFNNGAPCSVGTGACYRQGVMYCGTCSVQAGTPSPEVCNGIDDNCDGVVDNGIFTCYRDVDGDGYGNPAGPIVTGVCMAGGYQQCAAGYVMNNTDCNDNNPNVHPGAPDTPGDGVDWNCNGVD
jgi:hypothetical protein